MTTERIAFLESLLEKAQCDLATRPEAEYRNGHRHAMEQSQKAIDAAVLLQKQAEARAEYMKNQILALSRVLARTHKLVDAYDAHLPLQVAIDDLRKELNSLYKEVY